uniref:Uncharacterized protein n=1 Tax=viral metagenome TaxID=1070528 RepID=A0A6M3MBT0_9ZZZZ
MSPTSQLRQLWEQHRCAALAVAGLPPEAPAEVMDAVCAVVLDIEDKIAEAPARTPHDIGIKACLLWYVIAGREYGTAFQGGPVPSPEWIDGDKPTKVLWQIIRDLDQLAARSAHAA